MEPFSVVQTSPGSFSLLLSQFSPADEVFERAGREGGGYAWESIARHVASTRPDIAGRFSFDPEAGMFCAYGTDRAALEELGRALAVLFHDADKLAAAIAAIPDDAWED